MINKKIDQQSHYVKLQMAFRDILYLIDII